MAMLISKFHRLIQSKLLWASFLVIVVFTFVIWGTQMPAQSKEAKEASSPGKLYGDYVPQDQFRQAYFNTYLSVIMTVGQTINITPNVDKQLRQAAWERLVSLKEAHELGLTAIDDEVADAIQTHEGFQENGQFNKFAYKAFVENFLARMGFTERQFEEHIREEILLQKMRRLLAQTTLVAPYDVKRMFSSINDRFKIEYVILKDELVKKDVKISKEEAKAFFDKDPTLFTIPEQVRVSVVGISVTNFLANAVVTEEEIQVYYNDNIDQYRIEEETTNSLESSTNFLANITNQPLYQAYDIVKDDIAELLKREAAAQAASDKAMEFIDTLATDRDGNAPTFEDAAKKFGWDVKELAPFMLQEKIKGIDAGADFNQAAFQLTLEPDAYFSDPIEGKNSVYVMALKERIPERVPTFDEVADDVMPVAKQQAIEDALKGKAAEIRDAAKAAIGSTNTFASVVKSYGLKAIETEEFTASIGPTEDDYSNVLMRGILTLNEGEVSELLPGEDAILIAYVKERKAADPTTFESLRQQIINTVRRQHGRYVFDDWQKYALSQANLEERKMNIEESEVEPEAETENSEENL